LCVLSGRTKKEYDPSRSKLFRKIICETQDRYMSSTHDVKFRYVSAYLAVQNIITHIITSLSG